MFEGSEPVTLNHPVINCYKIFVVLCVNKYTFNVYHKFLTLTSAKLLLNLCLENLFIFSFAKKLSQHDISKTLRSWRRFGSASHVFSVFSPAPPGKRRDGFNRGTGLYLPDLFPTDITKRKT